VVRRKPVLSIKNPQTPEKESMGIIYNQIIIVVGF
jgi:hypothetical protein